MSLEDYLHLVAHFLGRPVDDYGRSMATYYRSLGLPAWAAAAAIAERIL